MAAKRNKSTQFIPEKNILFYNHRIFKLFIPCRLISNINVWQSSCVSSQSFKTDSDNHHIPSSQRGPTPKCRNVFWHVTLLHAWILPSSGLLCSVDLLSADVSRQPTLPIFKGLGPLTLKIVPIGCPETSVFNQITLRNNSTEEFRQTAAEVYDIASWLTPWSSPSW
jgi:hypothetical protein